MLLFLRLRRVLLTLLLIVFFISLDLLLMEILTPMFFGLDIIICLSQYGQWASPIRYFMQTLSWNTVPDIWSIWGAVTLHYQPGIRYQIPKGTIIQSNQHRNQINSILCFHLDVLAHNAESLSSGPLWLPSILLTCTFCAKLFFCFVLFFGVVVFIKY